jgi:hypothetical protein
LVFLGYELPEEVRCILPDPEDREVPGGLAGVGSEAVEGAAFPEEVATGAAFPAAEAIAAAGAPVAAGKNP